MGKIVTVILTVVFTTAAVVVFFTRDDESPRDQVLMVDDHDPRIVLDDFAIYRYSGHQLTSSFSAKLGHFIEPNVVETYAAVRGVRYRDGNVESLRCEAAVALFNADDMNDFFGDKQAEIQSAEVEDRVRLGIGENIVMTEHARYLANSSTLSSQEPVQVEGPNRTFVGESGFKYNLTKEILEMPGEVKGVVQADEFK